MSGLHNSLGQPIGAPVPTWTERRKPPKVVVRGQYASVEPLNPNTRGAELFEAAAEDKEGRMWTYLPYGPFATRESYSGWMYLTCMGEDPQFYSIVDLKGGAVGIASLMRIDPKGGSIEIGHVSLSPRGQRSRVATEAMFLMMRRVFDELAYRRFESKCDALNAPSRAAAERLGFTFEGVFRQATMYKGRNRDTACYAIIDKEWLFLKRAFEAWLNPDNFDADGQQKTRLSVLTAEALRAARAPIT
jgi:RimJ/RimL family protein N-acetyltransferase